jgi:hypothetical protein
MNYDWNGIRTRRTSLVKRVFLLFGLGLPLTLLLWLQFVH